MTHPQRFDDIHLVLAEEESRHLAVLRAGMIAALGFHLRPLLEKAAAFDSSPGGLGFLAREAFTKIEGLAALEQALAFSNLADPALHEAASIQTSALRQGIPNVMEQFTRKFDSQEIIAPVYARHVVEDMTKLCRLLLAAAQIALAPDMQAAQAAYEAANATAQARG